MSDPRRRRLLTDWTVPSPHPGELGYSVIARYLRSWGGLDPVGLMTQLVGHRPASNHPACIPGVRRVAQICLPGVVDPAGKFIFKHTLLPYYMAFESKKEASRWMEVLRTDDRACIGTLLRPTALRIGAPLGLRLCRTCFDVDLRSGREPFWRRAHQLPGVFHCTIHGERLLVSSVAFLVDKSLRYLTPDSTAVQSSLRPPKVPFFDRQLERAIASRSARLVTGSLAGAVDGSAIVYRRHLMQFGFGGRKNELRTSAFEADFRKWLRAYACDSERIGLGRWWLRLMTAIPGRSTPLQHLILRQYLREKMNVSLKTIPDLFGFRRATLS